ncbi:hypothetical protein ES319_D07G195700v1 [Gossypium barbadense]|uniref:Uncharacterized protein n=2 Tax=Gossypium TaxID=3633 RepID=A0A5J5QUN6_GOSBA|nr:hypothetical protein ES319_D07G195700v1 [Gossypium barbadense]TYG62220.1 hypothetical protein ES288_D07G211100v1 [Gossypium darwinii]
MFQTQLICSLYNFQTNHPMPASARLPFSVFPLLLLLVNPHTSIAGMALNDWTVDTQHSVTEGGPNYCHIHSYPSFVCYQLPLAAFPITALSWYQVD